MHEDDVLTRGTLAWFMRRRLNESWDEWYLDSVVDFPAWAADHPDEEARFKELLAAAIVAGNIDAQPISRVAGHITPDADPVSVDGVLRMFWFELWVDEPIPGDFHPLPPWWWRWRGTAYISTADLWGLDGPDELDDRDWEYLERHNITWDDLVAGSTLFDVIVPPGDRLPVYLGYLRMLRARWEAGDTTATPSLPPEPDDLDEALKWVDWWPGSSDAELKNTQISPSKPEFISAFGSRGELSTFLPSSLTKEALVSYMRSSALILVSRSQIYDALNETAPPIALAYWSDGHFIWSSESVAYVERYDLALPLEFIDHVALHVEHWGDQPPQISEEALRIAYKSLTSRSSE